LNGSLLQVQNTTT